MASCYTPNQKQSELPRLDLLNDTPKLETRHLGSLNRSFALPFASVDLSSDLLGRLLVNSATDGNAGSEDLLDSAAHFPGHGLVGFSHGLGNLKDIIELQVTVVNNVLDLLPVSAELLEGLQDQRSSGWQDSDSALSVLDGNLNLDFDTFPLSGGLLNVFTDFLWRKTDGTALWSKSGSRSDFTSNDFHVN